MLREEDGTNGWTTVSSFCNASLCVRAITLERINSCLLGDAPLWAPCIYGHRMHLHRRVVRRPFLRCLFCPAVVSNNVFFDRVLVEQGRAEEAAEHWWHVRAPRSTKGRRSHPKWGVRSRLPELGEGSAALHELVWQDLTLGERAGRSGL